MKKGGGQHFTSFSASPMSRRCTTPLDVKIALDLEEKRNEKDELAAMVTEKVCQKPEKLTIFFEMT